MKTIAAPTGNLADRIRAATLASRKNRNKYSDKKAAALSKTLMAAQDDVGKAILHYKALGSLPENKLAAANGLEYLHKDIESILSQLKKEHSVAIRATTKEAFTGGIHDGIETFTNAQMPGYKELTDDGINKLATSMFTLVDTSALDFLVNYNVQLAGDVNRELLDGIKRNIMHGVATGASAEDIVRNMGSVVIDAESFRNAGGRVFPSAQARLETIARTEIIRAHNQGTLKFEMRVGVQRFEWVAAEDERMCPVCGALNSKVFDAAKFPNLPAHPLCRCTHVVAWPLAICGEGEEE